MSETKPNPVVRLLPSLTDVAFLMPIVFLFTTMRGAKWMLGDGDTGWHLRTGEWIIAHRAVPREDMFSYTMPGEPWFAWEWLWDVIFAWLYRLGGMEAVVLASMLVISFTFAMLFRLVRRKSGNVFLAIGVTLLAIMGSTIHWLARPHLFTLLFVVVFYSLLERARDGNRRALLWLPLLTVLWTNLHGGWFLGVIMIGAYAAGAALVWLVAGDPEKRRAGLTASKPFALAALGCAAASFINPYFYQLHTHIYKYLTDSYHLHNIAEFQSVSFHHPLAFVFEAMIVLGIVAAFWTLRRGDFTYAILLLGFLHAALVSARNIPLYLIVAAPVAAMTLREILQALSSAPVAGWLRSFANSLESGARDFDETDRIGRWHVASAVVLLLVGAVFYAPNPPDKFRAEYDPRRYPVQAVEFLRTPGFVSGVFTDDEWGDYLIYRLYPDIKVFIDGRSDFYGAEFGEKFLNVIRVRHGWQDKLDKYGVDTVLLPVDASLAGALKESRHWRVVYNDGVAIVFRSIAPVRRAAPPLRAESEQSSAVACGSGTHRDLRVTKSNTRSESL